MVEHDANGRNPKQHKKGKAARGGPTYVGSKSHHAELKFAPLEAGGSNPSFIAVKDAIVTRVQKEYQNGKDIATSLRELRYVDMDEQMPRCRKSTKNPEEEKVEFDEEQEQFKAIFNEEVKMWLKKKEQFQDNKSKAYALIVSEYCTKSMMNAVEQEIDFEDRIRNDPVELLITIRNLMHETVETNYCWVTSTEALRRLLNLRLKDEETTVEYAKRFKALRDVVTSQLGDDIFTRGIERSAEYKQYNKMKSDPDAAETVEQMALKDNAMEAAMTWIFIRGCERPEFVNMKNQLAIDFAKGVDKYPRTIDAAVKMMGTYVKLRRSEQQKIIKKKNALHQEENSTSNELQTSFVQEGRRKGVCFCCGKKGHVSSKCRERQNTPREQWWINKTNRSHAEITTQEEHSNNQSDDLSSVGSATSSVTGSVSSRRSAEIRGHTRRGWANSQIRISLSQFPIDDLREVLILDTGATSFLTICNPDFLYNIRLSKNPTELATNNGIRRLTLEGDMLGFPKPGLFDPDMMVNVVGFSALAEIYPIAYDPIDDSFRVHVTYEDGSTYIAKFNRDHRGLYTFRPSNEFFNETLRLKGQSPLKMEYSNIVATLEENKLGYTQRQFERAKRARKLFHILGAHTVEKFKQILRQNVVKNCPVTAEDASIAENIFGPDVSALKGKRTRRRPHPVQEDLIEIPPEITQKYSNLELCIDIMFVCGIPLLTSIDRSIRFRSLVPLDSRKAEDIFKGLELIVRKYRKNGFSIKCIQADQEFKSILGEVTRRLNIDVNYANTDDHVPEAERNNRTIAERIRTAYHRLPFKAMPKVMIKNLAMVSANMLNLLPAKGGVSPYFSPHVILGGPPLDYNKHCKASFGAYVAASNPTDPRNSMQERSIDAIYLRPNNNIQGGHQVMDLVSGREVNRSVVEELPMTPAVIRTVEAFAEAQGIKSLKFKNRHGISLHPADWIAGVDYNENDDEEDDDYIYEEEEEEEDDDSDDDDLSDIEQQEIRELFAEPGQNRYNPTAGNDNEDAHDVEPATDDDEETEDGDREINEDPTQDDELDSISEQQTTTSIVESGRPKRVCKAPRRLSPVPGAKSYESLSQVTTKNKKVTFNDEELTKLEYCHNLIASVHPNPDDDVEYNPDLAPLIAKTMVEFNERVAKKGTSFAQQFILQEGLRVFGERGETATRKELDQLHQRNCFTPIHVSEMTHEEKKKAMEALMFLTEKRDKTVKGRMVYNGKPTREWLSREDSASPTVSLESIMLTAVIDAYEGRDVMTADVPNAFIQTDNPEPEDGKDRVIMKITGVLVDKLVELAHDKYGEYVVFENGTKVLYVRVLKAIYGMLQAALLWYKKFRKDLEGIGFVFNPYDPCVANREIKGSQHTVRFHVDDLMSSHKHPEVNDEFEKWLNKMYGEYGNVKATRGTIHDYLGMVFDFSDTGKVKINMRGYVDAMVDEFPVKLGESDVEKTPAKENLFSASEGELLSKKRKEIFHTFVARGLFLSKRARPDIHMAITVLCTRVKAPRESDWKKLLCLLKYLNGTRDDQLILSADDLRVMKWYVDSAFAVHPDFKSHTGGVLTFGRGAVQSLSRKQKLNTKSSTESELVGADDASVLILWSKLFMEKQGYDISKNILYQDNKSTILLEKNGKKSSGKKTRALNIRYFFITDQVEKGNVVIEYCPTGEMIGDYMSKPLQGKQFLYFKKQIMGHVD